GQPNGDSVWRPTDRIYERPGRSDPNRPAARRCGESGMTARTPPDALPERPQTNADSPLGAATPATSPITYALRAVARVLGYFIALILLRWMTFLPLGIAPVPALQSLWTGAVGDSATGHLYPLSESLVKTSPLLLTGLGVVVAWRAGLFSIGGEGQLLMG